MDPIKILKRAWNILWSYKALWVFGVILALTTAGGFPPPNRGSHGSGSSNNSNSRNFPPSESFSQGIQEFRKFWNEDLPNLSNLHLPQEDVRALITIGIIFLVLLIATVIVMTFARYVAETAVIRMVDEYEATGNKPSIRQGFRFGWSRTSWRMFLINLLVSLPIILIVLLMLAVGVVVFLLIIQNQPVLAITSAVIGIGIFFLGVFALFILGVVLKLLIEFFWRACALEQVGVRESLRLGWGMVRKNLGNVLLMWLVMFGVRLAWMIFMIVALFVLLPVLAITFLLGLVVGGLPALVVGGLSSLFISGYIPWIVGAIFGLPLFLLVTTSPLIFLSGLERVFSSSVWTLTYRELKAMPVLAPVENSAPEIVAPEI